MGSPIESDDEKFDQHTENELKRIKLSAEFGADFNNVSSGGVSPEVEGQFLDYIQLWEEQYAKQQTIVVYDLLERPEWKPIAEMDDNEVANELERIYQVLDDHSIDLSTLCDVEVRELYRFITEELFKVEVDDIRIQGMRHCFIYEEFHPNHEYDIKNRCSELVEHITTAKCSELVSWGLNDQVSYNGELFTKEHLNDRMLTFVRSFEVLKVHEITFVEVTVSDSQSQGKALCRVAFTGRYKDNLPFEHEGLWEFRLRIHYGWWLVGYISTGFQF